MSQETETTADEPGESRISVSRVAPAGVATDLIIRAVETALDRHPVSALNVAIVSDAKMGELHGQYMDDPTPTDVLTFDLRDNESDAAIDGEIVVSVDTARTTAAELGLDEREELLRYVVHGVLHLLGYDDQSDEERRRMREREDAVLAALPDGPASRKREE